LRVNGVLVRLLADTTGCPSHWFGLAFGPVLADLDVLHWCPDGQPWMGAPAHFDEDGPVWRRGGLGRYWRHFAEEYIELWGFASAAPPRLREQNAAAVLRYTDSTCWELYTDLPGVAERAFQHAASLPQVVAARARSDRRGEAFGFVGLSEVWRAMRGRA
jgi:hypothetical protein